MSIGSATAKEVIRHAIEAYKERGTRPTHIPNVKNKVVAGMSGKATRLVEMRSRNRLQ